jgi:hypothetical protein
VNVIAASTSAHTWTARGTIALATVTLIAVIVTIILTVQDRHRAR